MKKKEQILYLFPNKSSFIQNDINFLSEKYNIIEQNCKWSQKFLLPFCFIAQFVFFLSNIRKTKHIIISFAGYWSLIPVVLGKIFGTPVSIILNGTDCVSFPKYNYGSLRKPILKYFIKKSLQYATELLPVSKSLVFINYSYTDNCIYPKQGFKYHFPKINTPYKIIPNGFDTNFWNRKNSNRIPNSFITVAIVDNETTFKMKGIDRFIEMAINFPDSKFTLVGVSDTMKAKINPLPNNIKCYRFINKNDLLELFNRNSFYVQLSINEGFGCSLCEAMLSGCIPIGSDVGIISQIIDKTGFIIKKNNFNLIENTFKNALDLSFDEKEHFSKLASKRIEENFPSELRERELIKIIEQSI